jgi:UDP-N-acetylmuramyl pentapeptide phosphotransferase/UDP-N-acetylglucosamine-1-phosphate transferase
MIWIKIAVVAGLAVAVSLGLNRVMLAVAPRLGLMDEPGERRIHSTAIPRAGGIAIWLSFLLVITIGLATGLAESRGSLAWDWLGAFAAGSAVLMVAGILDDRTGLSPWVKLGAHVLAPTVFFLLHPMRTGLLPADWPLGCDYVVMVGWTVVLINAFNLIDGLDGLCGGLALVAVLALAGLAFAKGQLESATLLLVMGGTILGFLKYNISPARIFLGDAGSMLLGFFLATAATEALGRKAVVGVIMLPIAVAGVPLLDVLLAIWRRWARGWLRQLRGEEPKGGIFSADSDHLHHRILRAGGSHRRTALILQGIAILLAVLAFLPMFLGDRLLALSLVGFLVVILVGVRNLARVEIEHTGSVVQMAIKLPGNRRRVAALLFAYDVMVFVAAGVAAVLIETNLLIRGAQVTDLARFVVVFAVMGSLALLMVGVHRRLWVRATMREVIALHFWLWVAAMMTFTLFSAMFASLEWSALRLTVMSYVFACWGVCVPRVALNLMLDWGLEAWHRNPKRAPGGYGPVVVLGAGDLGTLFIDHLKSSPHNYYAGMRVLGFIDQTAALHGRHLRSFRVLGGLSSVPKLVDEAGLKGVIVAINEPNQELLDELNELAERHRLKIHRWGVGLEEEQADRTQDCQRQDAREEDVTAAMTKVSLGGVVR